MVSLTFFFQFKKIFAYKVEKEDDKENKKKNIIIIKNIFNNKMEFYIFFYQDIAFIKINKVIMGKMVKNY